MQRRSHRVFNGLAVLALLALYFGAAPLSARAAADALRLHAVGTGGALQRTGVAACDVASLSVQFDPEFTMEAVLPPGSLGLPGEPITWVLRVTNTGLGAGKDLTITNTLRDELQIDSAAATKGDVAVNAQTVAVAVAELAPAASVEVQIDTTVRRGPPNGLLMNQALLEGDGPAGPVSRVAMAEVFVPTGLPATGYPEIGAQPGDGEPSFVQLGLAALAAVAATAYTVYRRGRR